MQPTENKRSSNPYLLHPVSLNKQIMKKPSERIKEIVLRKYPAIYGEMTLDRAEINELKRLLNRLIDYLDEQHDTKSTK